MRPWGWPFRSMSRTLAAREVLRAKIILRLAMGESFRSIARALDCDHRTAWQWARRWESAGFDGIEHEQAGRGRKSWVIANKGQEILQKTPQERPTNATHWSRATMALARPGLRGHHPGSPGPPAGCQPAAGRTHGVLQTSTSFSQRDSPSQGGIPSAYRLQPGSSPQR